MQLSAKMRKAAAVGEGQLIWASVGPGSIFTQGKRLRLQASTLKASKLERPQLIPPLNLYTLEVQEHQMQFQDIVLTGSGICAWQSP